VRSADEYARLAEAIAPATRRLYAGIDPGDLAIAHEVPTKVIDQAGRLRQEV
jgi:hypothetical protein